MDPQTRLQLEVAYKALENGGITLGEIAGSKTAVFIGVFSDDYSNMMLSDPESLPPHHVTGTGKAIFANRISYFFDLKGPSLALDTGCSASLVALHQACQSIRLGESEQAMVGGVNLMISPKTVMSLGGLGFLSEEGRCYSFDSRGSGYGRGEGVAAVVLKPLKDAIANRDPIRAVIRNTVVNQDGRTTGLTMPSCEAQVSMMQDAYTHAGLHPADTQYVEAHGTGTKAKDPIEVAAIATALTRSREPSDPLILGSVKANIGHLGSAYGIAGLIKAISCLEQGMIPPSINFESENPELFLSDRNMKVATLESFCHGLLVAYDAHSLNSFGYGGTNAHVILDAYQHAGHRRSCQNTESTSDGGSVKSSREHDTIRHKKLFLMTHRTKAGTERLAEDLPTYIKANMGTTDCNLLHHLAYTIGSRRTKFRWGCAVTAATLQDLAAALDPQALEIRKAPRDIHVAYIFTGQGAQWYAMGRGLIGQYEVFNTTLQAADSHMQSLGGSWSVMDELLEDSSSSCVNSAAIGQPLCTAIQCALVDLLRSWHITPDSVMGHSSGEIVAAYACGSLALQWALTVSYHRGRLASTTLEQNPKLRGGMLAAGISEAEAEGFIDRLPPGQGKAVVACVNSPRSVTISGDRSAIMSLRSMLEARQLFVRKLGVSIVYYSHHMEIVRHSYLAALQNLPVSSPNKKVRFFSPVTGDLMDGALLDGAYWVNNMVSQVKFSQALLRLYQASTVDQNGEASSLGMQATQLLLEIGPHSALAGPVKQTLSVIEGCKFKYVASLVRGQDAGETFLSAAKDLAVAGLPISLEAVNAEDTGHSPQVLSDLPPYPWDHSSSYWHESRLSLDYRKRSAPRHPLLGAPTPDFNRMEPTWRNIIRLSEIPWLLGHVVQWNVVYPAAGYIAMAIEAALQRHRLDRRDETIVQYKLKQVTIGKPLLIPDTAEGVETEFVLRPYNRSARKSSDLWDEFRVFSSSKDDGWTEHCRGLITVHYDHGNSEVEKNREKGHRMENHAKRMAEADVLCQSATNLDELYENLSQVGMHFQNAFRCTKNARAGAQQSFEHIRIPNTAEMMPAGIEPPHVLHPTTLDACMQMTTPILFETGVLKLPMVPTYVEEILVSNDIPRRAGERLLVHTELQLSTKRSLKARVTANREASLEPEPPLIDIKGLQCNAIPGGFSSGDQANGGSKNCHRLRWIPFEVPTADTTIVANLARPNDGGEALSRVILVQPAAVYPATDAVVSHLSTILSQRIIRTYSILEDISDPVPEQSICICLAELHVPILKQLSEPQWIALRKMLSSASNVLWITKGSAMTVDTPEAGLISGLARSAMSDNPALRLITLDTDPNQVSPEDTARSIVSVLDKVFLSRENKETLVDLEYVERAGQLFVPRVVEDDSLQQYLAADTMNVECENQTFIQPMRPLRLEVETPGLLDSLRFIEDTAGRAALAASELRMQPTCYGVNFRDVMIALGRLEETSLMSSEHSGIVTEVGKDLVDSFQVGDRICAWGGNAYASSIIMDGLAAQRIPDNMSFEEAASVPIVFATVYYGLVHLARLRKGESVLIHSGAGGVGQAAIMLAKYLQAEIFVTVGNIEKKALVIAKYGIPEDHIFSSRHLSFGTGVMRLTGGKGVDVVLNSIAGEAFHETVDCLGKLGRFIEIGKRDILEGTRLDMGAFNRSITFASVDLSIVFQHDAQLAKRMIAEVFTLLKQGTLQPVQPLNIFPLSDIEGAFRLMQAGKHTGKVILKAETDTVVKALPAVTAPAMFDANASYMIAGGLGGLGQAICRWMADRGCRNIIALSRSGMKSAIAKGLKDALEPMGVKLAVYACDVGDTQSVDRTVVSCAQEMPPIKGLINAGMVIRDTTINNMTLSDYNTALRPKVQGTWNLHNALSHLPNALDFFLLLSSCVGIVGNNGQSNYASGCTFQDAFARYRTRLGHPSRSLDLGMMEGAGYIHANPEIRRFAIAQGFQPVTLAELFAAIEYCITRPIRDDDDCQLMLGLTGGGKPAMGNASPINFSDAKFELLRRQDTAENSGQTSQSSLSALLTAASSEQEAHHIITDALIAQISKVLVVPIEDINPAMSISHYGGDSLAAVEIRNWVAKNLNASVGVMEILSGRSLDILAREIGGRSSFLREMRKEDKERQAN